jgi:hypothetical protein
VIPTVDFSLTTGEHWSQCSACHHYPLKKTVVYNFFATSRNFKWVLPLGSWEKITGKMFSSSVPNFACHHYLV